MPADLPCPALFVTGTDTGVGKTYVAAALAHVLTSGGLRVGVMKPAESGVSSPDEPGPDAALLRWASAASDPPEIIAPYRLKAPLSPSQAAALEKTTIDPTLISARLQTLSKGKDFVIIEGAGGLMVPLRGGYLTIDLIRDLKIPLLVVARTALGTLNHTLLTVFAARSVGIPVAGVILNGMPPSPDLAAESAPKQLAMIASADLLGVLPQVTGSDRECIVKLAGEIERMETRAWLMQAIGLGATPAATRS